MFKNIQNRGVKNTAPSSMVMRATKQFIDTVDEGQDIKPN